MISNLHLYGRVIAVYCNEGVVRSSSCVMDPLSTSSGLDFLACYSSGESIFITIPQAVSKVSLTEDFGVKEQLLSN